MAHVSVARYLSTMSIQPISAENQVANTRNWRFSKAAAEPVEIPFTVEQLQVIERAAGGLLVLGGPGSGKSEVIAAAVAERLNSGMSSESILVLTFDHAAAAVLKQVITLKTGGGISPAITTFHSFALSLFNEFNSHSEPPTLITASAQEVLLKELIEGILDEPLLAQRFRIQPEHVNMLRTKAMLVDIRNAIARAQVLGLTPTELSDIAANDPNWQLIADIYREYLNQLMLEHVIDYNQLVTEVTSMLQDDAIRARLQARFQAIYIDEYQDIDPLYVGVLREVINPAGLVVAAANPDQAVYQFRGAEDSAVLTFEDDFSHLLNDVSVTKLNQNFRSNQKLQTAFDLIIERNSDFPLLKKYGLTTRGLKALAPEESIPAVKVQGYESAEAEAESIASQIREIVLSSDSNLTWSDIAILVRTGSSSIPVLQQALAAADVPVSVVFDEVPLAEENVVRLLLTALEIAHAPSRLKEPHIARDLLTSPFANMSPTELRHLGRELKRSVRLPGTFSEQLVADALADRDFDIEPGDARAKDLLRRVRNLHELFYAVHNASRKGTPVAELLWKLWTDQSHDWPNQLRNKALASGYSAAVANHSLDAIRTLFKV
ncbi:MAG: hypothetical protein RL038_650, partial [Actinomycetota bacterium]